MSLNPHPPALGLCEASKTVFVIPWVDGVRRPSLGHNRTAFCDKPSYHTSWPGEAAREHYDWESGMSWVDEAEGKEK